MDEQKLQQQLVQLVQAAMQGDQKAQQQIQQIMQAAQQGDQQATQIAQMIQAIAQQMQQGQVQAAKFGAKLNYIRSLKGKCPVGYEMTYFKSGGTIKKTCKKCKQGDTVTAQSNDDVIATFKAKCGKKMKKKACGGNMDKAKCGKKMPKAQEGGELENNTIYNQSSNPNIWPINNIKYK